MKKTSYILFGALALLAVAAFAFPPLAFEKFTPTTNIIAASTESCTDTVAPFTSLRVNADYYLACDGPDDEKRNLQLIISECDTIDRPVIIMNRAWKDNTVFDTDGKALTINIDFHHLDEEENEKENTQGFYLYEPGCAMFARITVPTGMLETVAPQICDLTLADFKDASLTIYQREGNHTSMDNSSFKRLTIM